MIKKVLIADHGDVALRLLSEFKRAGVKTVTVYTVQDVNSEVKAVRAGFKSRSAVVLGSGEDPEQVDREQKDDNERADKAGLTYDSDPRRTNASGARQGTKTGAESADDDEGNNDDE